MELYGKKDLSLRRHRWVRLITLHKLGTKEYPIKNIFSVYLCILPVGWNARNRWQSGRCLRKKLLWGHTRWSDNIILPEPFKTNSGIYLLQWKKHFPSYDGMILTRLSNKKRFWFLPGHVRVLLQIKPCFSGHLCTGTFTQHKMISPTINKKFLLKWGSEFFLNLMNY